jgi:hypothetical protein
VPVTAKIAMRKSGPITTPVSLTSRNGESASLAEDGVSWRAYEFPALRVRLPPVASGPRVKGGGY